MAAAVTSAGSSGTLAGTMLLVLELFWMIRLKEYASSLQEKCSLVLLFLKIMILVTCPIGSSGLIDLAISLAAELTAVRRPVCCPGVESNGLPVSAGRDLVRSLTKSD